MSTSTPPTQSATGVNPWVNARWVTLHSLWRRRVRFGGLLPKLCGDHGCPAFVAKLLRRSRLKPWGLRWPGIVSGSGIVINHPELTLWKCRRYSTTRS